MEASLGLVGGTGGLPALMAREARRAGWRVVAFAFAEPGVLAEAVDRVVPCRIGEVGPIFDALTGERIRHVVLAGSLRKDGLFHGMPLDDTARVLVDRSPDWTDEGLLRTATAALAAMGIELLDQRRFLTPWLAAAGHVAGPALGEPGRADVARGLALARDLGRLGSTLGDLAPAIVFNLVGYGVDPEERSRPDERDATLLNAALPATLAEALDPVSTGWTGRRVVHAGSVFEYGRIGGDLAEHSPPRPEGLYGITKLAGTQGLAAACRRCGIPGLTARLCQLYGPGEPPGRLLPMLIAARTSGQLETMSQGTQRKDFTYVEDVAEGLLRLGATSGPPGEIVNLATGRLLSVRDFVLTAARLLPLPIDLLRFDNPAPDNELVHEPISIARLRELTEWSPGTTIDEGIRRTIAFGPD